MSSSTVARKALRNAVPTSFGSDLSGDLCPDFGFPVTACSEGVASSAFGPLFSVTCHPVALTFTDFGFVTVFVINYNARRDKICRVGHETKMSLVGSIHTEIS
jgi:hypothetical protein